MGTSGGVVVDSSFSTINQSKSVAQPIKLLFGAKHNKLGRSNAFRSNSMIIPQTGTSQYKYATSYQSSCGCKFSHDGAGCPLCTGAKSYATTNSQLMSSRLSNHSNDISSRHSSVDNSSISTIESLPSVLSNIEY